MTVLDPCESKGESLDAARTLERYRDGPCARIDQELIDERETLTVDSGTNCRARLAWRDPVAAETVD